MDEILILGQNDTFCRHNVIQFNSIQKSLLLYQYISGYTINTCQTNTIAVNLRQQYHKSTHTNETINLLSRYTTAWTEMYIQEYLDTIWHVNIDTAKGARNPDQVYGPQVCCNCNQFLN